MSANIHAAAIIKALAGTWIPIIVNIELPNSRDGLFSSSLCVVPGCLAWTWHGRQTIREPCGAHKSSEASEWPCSGVWFGIQNPRYQNTLVNDTFGLSLELLDFGVNRNAKVFIRQHRTESHFQTPKHFWPC